MSDVISDLTPGPSSAMAIVINLAFLTNLIVIQFLLTLSLVLLMAWAALIIRLKIRR